MLSSTPSVGVVPRRFALIGKRKERPHRPCWQRRPGGRKEGREGGRKKGNRGIKEGSKGRGAPRKERRKEGRKDSKDGRAARKG